MSNKDLCKKCVNFYRLHCGLKLEPETCESKATEEQDQDLLEAAQAELPENVLSFHRQRLVEAASRLPPEDWEQLRADLKAIKGFQISQYDARVAACRTRRIMQRAELDAAHVCDHIAITYIGKDTAILVPETNPHTKTNGMSLKRVQAVREMMANQLIEISPGKYRSLFDIWMQSDYRREYDGIVFQPGATDTGRYYNVWQGFPVEPVPMQGPQMVLMHIKSQWCGGDDKLYRAVIAFFANMFQKPAEKAQVALVLKGREGVGKSIIINAIGHLLGAHYTQISNPRHLVGNFNAHLKDTLLLFCDEAFWAGDKSKEGGLKALITESDLMIEPKGLDSYKIKNFMRVVMATNNDWAIPAGEDARRFIVLNVGDEYRGNHEYFGHMKKQLENGGYAALMHYFLNVDVSDVNPREYVVTEALLEQKMHSMDVAAQWWVSLMVSGHEIFDADDGVPKAGVFEHHRQWCQDMKLRPMNDVHLSRRMLTMCPGARSVRQRAGQGSMRQQVFIFPELDASRRYFEEHIGGDIDWDNGGHVKPKLTLVSSENQGKNEDNDDNEVPF